MDMSNRTLRTFRLEASWNIHEIWRAKYPETMSTLRFAEMEELRLLVNLHCAYWNFETVHHPLTTHSLAGLVIKWVDALETDPVFCPDSHFTEYQWLYNMDGLTRKQKGDLKLAEKSYLMARPRPRPFDFAPDTNKEIPTTTLPCEENHHRVFGILKNARANIQRRLRWKDKKD